MKKTWEEVHADALKNGKLKPRIPDSREHGEKTCIDFNKQKLNTIAPIIHTFDMNGLKSRTFENIFVGVSQV